MYLKFGDGIERERKIIRNKLVSLESDRCTWSRTLDIDTMLDRYNSSDKGLSYYVCNISWTHSFQKMRHMYLSFFSFLYTFNVRFGERNISCVFVSQIIREYLIFRSILNIFLDCRIAFFSHGNFLAAIARKNQNL